MRCDVAVLGAGMVGVCVALHLQKRGRSTVLLDRRGAAEETSFGNGGLIQREAAYPYGFPREFGALVSYALNRRVDAYYHLSALAGLAPFLWQYWRCSHPMRHAEIARRYVKLIEHCVSEHDALATPAGAGEYLQRKGWLRAYRTERERDRRFAEAEKWRREFGIGYRALDARALREMQPHVAPVLAGALHWTDAVSVDDPHALALAYLRLFERIGGRFMQGDAVALRPEGKTWRIGALAADAAVVALGPWSDVITKRLGYKLPLAVKRGYHMHYKGANLNYPMLDAEGGYFLGPMRRGVRLTTGAEFALRDAPRTPVQLARAEPLARELFPLGERLDAEPWMGSRPCTPDMLPVIGPAPRHAGLWFAFGHGHHGFTLGPVTGRLIADMMTGAVPFIDPAPYSASRFS